MKRTLSLLLILSLCLCLLCGCGKKLPPPTVPDAPTPTAEPVATDAPADEPTPEPEPEPTAEPEPEPTSEPLAQVDPSSAREGLWDVVPFDEMPYERPSLDGLRAAIDAVGEALDAGEPYEVIEPLLDACDDEYSIFYTMYSIAFIRSCQDTTDTYYAEEYAWLDETSADMSQLIEKLYFRCGMSDMAQELEEKYFWPGFAEEYADDSNTFYDDEMVALLQKESDLVAQYRDMVAAPTVTLADGTEVDYATSLEEFTGYAYLDLLIRYYNAYNEPLGQIYADLIRVRQEQAAHAGYDSYEAMAFDHSFERDYTPEEAAVYLQGIRDHIVPLYKEVAASGLLWSVDAGAIDAARLEQVLRSGLNGMGKDVEDTYEFMVQYRLCDISYSPLKSNMSFQTYLDAYEVPFLFMDATGTLDDITTFSHEFGHYLDGYLNFDASETIDLAECFSQSMELLMLARLDDALSAKELDDLYQTKMLDILSMYVQQGAFAEFEHIVYAADPDELDTELINSAFLQVAQDYGFCEEGFEFLYAMFWIDITHFFEQPFYVITYPVSHDIAMQIFQLEEAETGAGLAKFLDMLDRDYSDMLETVEDAGLQSPFDPGRLETVAATMRQILLD
ncbi:MAG: hypothetical protein IK095_08410 [Oscillospiraceae bacterium]|nr:hypothetical protein [Oscillospiraceae bacterium]